MSRAPLALLLMAAALLSLAPLPASQGAAQPPVRPGQEQCIPPWGLPYLFGVPGGRYGAGAAWDAYTGRLILLYPGRGLAVAVPGGSAAVVAPEGYTVAWVYHQWDIPGPWVYFAVKARGPGGLSSWLLLYVDARGPALAGYAVLPGIPLRVSAGEGLVVATGVTSGTVPYAAFMARGSWSVKKILTRDWALQALGAASGTRGLAAFTGPGQTEIVVVARNGSIIADYYLLGSLQGLAPSGGGWIAALQDRGNISVVRIGGDGDLAWISYTPGTILHAAACPGRGLLLLAARAENGSGLLERIGFGGVEARYTVNGSAGSPPAAPQSVELFAWRCLTGLATGGGLYLLGPEGRPVLVPWGRLGGGLIYWAAWWNDTIVLAQMDRALALPGRGGPLELVPQALRQAGPGAAYSWLVGLYTAGEGRLRLDPVLRRVLAADDAGSLGYVRVTARPWGAALELYRPGEGVVWEAPLAYARPSDLEGAAVAAAGGYAVASLRAGGTLYAAAADLENGTILRSASTPPGSRAGDARPWAAVFAGPWGARGVAALGKAGLSLAAPLGPQSRAPVAADVGGRLVLADSPGPGGGRLLLEAQACFPAAVGRPALSMKEGGLLWAGEGGALAYTAEGPGGLARLWLMTTDCSAVSLDGAAPSREGFAVVIGSPQEGQNRSVMVTWRNGTSRVFPGAWAAAGRPWYEGPVLLEHYGPMEAVARMETPSGGSQVSPPICMSVDGARVNLTLSGSAPLLRALGGVYFRLWSPPPPGGEPLRVRIEKLVLNATRGAPASITIRVEGPGGPVEGATLTVESLSPSGPLARVKVETGPGGLAVISDPLLLNRSTVLVATLPDGTGAAIPLYIASAAAGTVTHIELEPGPCPPGVMARAIVMRGIAILPEPIPGGLQLTGSTARISPRPPEARAAGWVAWGTWRGWAPLPVPPATLVLEAAGYTPWTGNLTVEAAARLPRLLVPAPPSTPAGRPCTR